MSLQMAQAIDVNSVADSGNSALHAAANMGSKELVRELLGARDINVNVQNSSCENATPLHVSVMHGQRQVLLNRINLDKMFLQNTR